tara:strand:+ start:28 stop:489 length:462 start_codon:yes stop_codon:yes gene_type:complete
MSIKIISTNRKAHYKFHIIGKYEAGIVLVGSEVKSLRESKVTIKESYVKFIKNELYTIGMHIAEYSHAGYSSHDPIRFRKLLLHKKELSKISRSIQEKGMTLIPLKLYFKGGKVKLEFATAKGKRLWDKRQDIMKKDIQRQSDRNFKNKKIKI